MGKQNAAVLENAMKMFSPFGATIPGRSSRKEGAETKSRDEEQEEIEELREKLDALQTQIDTLTKKQKG